MKRDYSRKRHRNPNAIKKPPERFPWKRWVVPTALLAAIAGWAWLLVFSNAFRITDIRVEGNDRIQNWEIEDALDELMNQRYAYLVPKRSLVLLSERAIREHLLNRFVLDHVEVMKDPPHRLVLTIKERVSTIFMLMPDGSQAILDLDGSIIKTYRPKEALEIARGYGPTKETRANPAEGLPILFSDSSTVLSLRDRTVSSAVVKAVIRIPRLLEETFGGGLRSGEIHVRDFDSATIRVVTTEGWSIYLDANTTLDTQVANAKTVIQTKLGSDRSVLEYIDARFGEKIFIKTK